MRHTPGPWTVTPVLRPDLDDDPMGQYKVEPAARILTDQYENIEMDEKTDEYNQDQVDAVHAVQEANCRLIAAAPTLLGALEGLVDALEWALGAIPAGAAAPSDLEEAMRRHAAAESALAAARGER